MSETKICTSNNFPTDLSKSFYIQTPKDDCSNSICSKDDCKRNCSKLESSDSNAEINDECPGGVCSISNKRKMCPPGSVDNSPILPQLDKLFSQILGNVDEKTKDILKSSIENNSHKERDLSDDTNSDYSEEDEEEESEYEKESEYNHSKCILDARWDAINKLLESHLIIANTVSTLISKGHKSGDEYD